MDDGLFGTLGLVVVAFFAFLCGAGIGETHGNRQTCAAWCGEHYAIADDGACTCLTVAP